MMEAGSSSFEEMEDVVPLGTQPYLFEPEASSDEDFNQQSSPDSSTNEDRLGNSEWYVLKKILLRIYFAHKSFFYPVQYFY